MNESMVETVLFQCMVINVALLVISFGLVMGMRSMVERIHSRLFQIPEEFVRRAIYVFFGFYKILIFFFLVVPWVALKIAVS